MFLIRVVLLCLGLMSQSAVAQTVFVGTSWDTFSYTKNGTKFTGAEYVCDDTDIDNDDDGLIEVCFLETLNAVRYQPDGSGLQTTSGATKSANGCKTGGCTGYELVRDLDFQSDDSYRDSATHKENWTTGTGWLPLGDTFANRFRGIFEGNGHTVSNLVIKRPGSLNVGFFGISTGSINSLGLLDVSVRGLNDVGGLVGRSEGTITNSFTSGFVSGVVNTGGLVAVVGTTHPATVSNSYSTARVEGRSGGTNTGGLAGQSSSNGNYTNSYSTGLVTGVSAGGLLGSIAANGGVRSCYSTSLVMGSSAGGFSISIHRRAIVRYNYWNIETSGQSSSAGQGDGKIEGKTTAEMRAPTAPGQTTSDIYYGWSTDDWDFGTSKEYPALKVNGNGKCRMPTVMNSQQQICGSLLRGQRKASDRDRILTIGKTTSLYDANKISGLSGELTYLWEKLSGPDDVTFTTNTQVLTVTAPDDQNLGGKTLLFLLRVNGQPFQLPTISINAETTGTVVIDGRNAPDELIANIDGVSDANGLVKDETSYQWFRQMVGGSTFEAAPGATSRSSTYTLSVSKAGRAAGTKYQVLVTFVDTLGVETTLTSADYEIKNQTPVIAAIAPLSVAEAMTIDVTDKVSDPNRDALSYAWRVLTGDKPSSLLAGQATATTLTVPANWVVGTEAKRTTVTLQLTVSDATTQTATSLTVVIAKTNNGSLSLAADPTRDGETLTAPMLDLTDDPDSTATARGSILSYQWQQCTSTDCSPANSWSNVTEEVSTASFTVPKHLVRVDSQFRVLIKYKDGQGYDERLTSGALAYPKAEMRMRLRVFLEGALQ